MITDNQTNFLFLANSLPIRYPAFYKRFEQLLCECEVNFALLPHTKDIWIVDFMPVQIDTSNFVRFTYNPAYLRTKKQRKTISDVDKICELIGVNTLKTDIIIDGGNIVHGTNRAIMTDRIFKDNPNYSRKELLKNLHELLQMDKIYLIPEQPADFTGHADGMVRFVDENTVVINDYKKEKESFYRAFLIAIHNAGLEYITIPYNVYNNKFSHQANGTYINYLHMKDTIVIPTFGMQEDEVAVQQLERLFSGKRIRTIESNEIASEGGILNCITWNIQKNNEGSP